MTRVTLLLAQGPGLPEGDLSDRLVLNLALNNQGMIDASAYDTDPHPWLACRQRNGRPPRPLEVVRVDEGWALQSTSSDDDPIWSFEGHVFRPGELMSLHRPDGEQLLFRIVNVERADIRAVPSTPDPA